MNFYSNCVGFTSFQISIHDDAEYLQHSQFIYQRKFNSLQFSKTDSPERYPVRFGNGGAVFYGCLPSTGKNIRCSSCRTSSSNFTNSYELAFHKSHTLFLRPKHVSAIHQLYVILAANCQHDFWVSPHPGSRADLCGVQPGNCG